MSSLRQSVERKRHVTARSTRSLKPEPQRPRLVMDASCTTCGQIDTDDPFNVQNLAVEHAARTGHIIVLNGTADVPDSDLRA